MSNSGRWGEREFQMSISTLCLILLNPKLVWTVSVLHWFCGKGVVLLILLILLGENTVKSTIMWSEVGSQIPSFWMSFWLVKDPSLELSQMQMVEVDDSWRWCAWVLSCFWLFHEQTNISSNIVSTLYCRNVGREDLHGLLLWHNLG